MDGGFDMFGSSDFAAWSDDGGSTADIGSGSSSTWAGSSSGSGLESDSGTESPCSFESPWGEHGLGGGGNGLFAISSASPFVPFVPMGSGEDMATATEDVSSYMYTSSTASGEETLMPAPMRAQMPGAQVPAQMPVDMPVQMDHLMVPQLSDMLARRPPVATAGAGGAGGYGVPPPVKVVSSPRINVETPAPGTTAEVVARGRLQKLERWEDFEQLLVSHLTLLVPHNPSCVLSMLAAPLTQSVFHSWMTSSSLTNGLS